MRTCVKRTVASRGSCRTIQRLPIASKCLVRSSQRPAPHATPTSVHLFTEWPCPYLMEPQGSALNHFQDQPSELHIVTLSCKLRSFLAQLARHGFPLAISMVTRTQSVFGQREYIRLIRRMPKGHPARPATPQCQSTRHQLRGWHRVPHLLDRMRTQHPP